MKKTPLVSIHIITYNQIDFIHETLTSALEQDYENLEVVVADDGSSDGTAEVILEYAKKFPNRLVPLVGGPNLGITGNSNRALKACKGKYIAFQGGDDVLLPGKITAQVEWMEENDDRVLCGHQIEVIYENDLNRHKFSRKLTSGTGCKQLIEKGTPFRATSIMVRICTLPKNGFDDRLPTVSDQKLWIDCLSGGGEYGFVDGVYAQYRKHDNNITHEKELCNLDVEKMFLILEEEHPKFNRSILKGRVRTIEYAQGITLMKEGNFGGSIISFWRCVKIYPMFWKAYFRSAQSIYLIFIRAIVRGQ